MQDVEQIFKPSTKDLLSLFSENGVIFQVPAYQRNYTWSTNDLNRLVGDIATGFSKVDEPGEFKTLCFLGSIITVNVSSEIDVVACPLNIVDGQQRLTSTMILISVIDSFLKFNFDQLKLKLPENLQDWLADELKEVHRNTKKSLFEDKARDNKPYELLPKIIRENVDKPGFRQGRFRYRSSVSVYLQQYAEYIFNNDIKFSFVSPTEPDSPGVENALKYSITN